MRDRGEKRKIHEMPNNAEPARAMRIRYFNPLNRSAPSKLFSPLNFSLLPLTQYPAVNGSAHGTDIAAENTAKEKGQCQEHKGPRLLSG